MREIHIFPNELNDIYPMESIKNRKLDMTIALAVFLACCILSFLQNEEVAKSLYTNLMP